MLQHLQLQNFTFSYKIFRVLAGSPVSFFLEILLISAVGWGYIISLACLLVSSVAWHTLAALDWVMSHPRWNLSQNEFSPISHIIMLFNRESLRLSNSRSQLSFFLDRHKIMKTLTHVLSVKNFSRRIIAVSSPEAQYLRICGNNI